VEFTLKNYRAPDAVNLETGIITITAEVSKAREPRKITIQPNLAAWLHA
jgi:hypothetical protein